MSFSTELDTDFGPEFKFLEVNDFYFFMYKKGSGMYCNIVIYLKVSQFLVQ